VLERNAPAVRIARGVIGAGVLALVVPLALRQRGIRQLGAFAFVAALGVVALADVADALRALKVISLQSTQRATAERIGA